MSHMVQVLNESAYISPIWGGGGTVESPGGGGWSIFEINNFGQTRHELNNFFQELLYINMW